MNKTIVISAIVVAAIIIIGTAIFINSEDINDNGAASNINENLEGNVVEISEAGFFPQTIEINQGESVIFVNTENEKHWPATNVHPTHKGYPGSDISKCGSEEENAIFDSCKGLQQEESYTFIFNEEGTWGYHDHLNPGLTGNIVVN